jgi:hypothetical protein
MSDMVVVLSFNGFAVGFADGLAAGLTGDFAGGREGNVWLRRHTADRKRDRFGRRTRPPVRYDRYRAYNMAFAAMQY